MRIEVLPARLGDCLLVECLREDGRPWRMLIDGGPPDTWPQLEQRLSLLDDPYLDVVVITHIDSDHIGGIIPFLASEFASQVGDVWFNGRPHLPEPGTKRSVAQGESLVAALLGDETQRRVLPWNLAFGGEAIDTGEAAGFLEVTTDDGPRITVISPTTKRLEILSATWWDALEDAKRGEETQLVPDVVPPLRDLAELAAEKSGTDRSAPNGSSIGLLVEHRGASALLTGDGFGNVLGAGLAGLARARGVETLSVDAFKLPHHGSRNNVIEAMLRLAPAQHYLISSNGDTFHHPDDVAIARVVLNAPPEATLWFNYRTPRTERWDDPDLRGRHRYRTAYPDDPGVGTVLALPARP